MTRPRIDNFRDRTLRLIERLARLEEVARDFAATNGSSSVRVRLASAAMDFTAAARTLGGKR